MVLNLPISGSDLPKFCSSDHMLLPSTLLLLMPSAQQPPSWTTASNLLVLVTLGWVLFNGWGLWSTLEPYGPVRSRVHEARPGTLYKFFYSALLKVGNSWIHFCIQVVVILCPRWMPTASPFPLRRQGSSLWVFSLVYLRLCCSQMGSTSTVCGGFGQIT